MKQLFTKPFFLIAVFFIFAPVTTFAHQPRIVESEVTQVVDPEMSKAYYGILKGTPHIYTFNATKSFDLYVGILVPSTKNPQKKLSASIYKNNEPIKTIGGENADWKFFFEPFGQSTYWDGGEYKISNAEPGVYKIVVSSPDNTGKYSLAIGEIEAFDLKEILYALNVVPKLKSDFFDESPAGFIKSPFGWGYILIMYLLAFVFGFLYRAMLKKFAKNSLRKKQKNIGTFDRLIRLAIGTGLLFIAITTSWSPWLIFFSGFAIFEATFSWCGFYAAIGKNTCPV